MCYHIYSNLAIATLEQCVKFVQSQQQRHWNNLRNHFNVNNEDTTTISTVWSRLTFKQHCN